MKKLKERKDLVRYAISVDFDCMFENGYTSGQAISWFESKECKEAYEGNIKGGVYIPTGENFLGIVNEVFNHNGYKR